MGHFRTERRGCQQLGMNRSTLQFRMRKLGILRARELMIRNLA